MLEITNLTVGFETRRGRVTAIDDVSLAVQRNEILGLVGESGAGKSTVGSAIMGLLDNGRVLSGKIVFDGADLLLRSADEMARLRGRQIGMIFQDPMTALNPVRTVGSQLVETIQSTLGLSTEEARDRSIIWLRRMGIGDPELRFDGYPHEFSGGQLQRIVIALALCGEPKLVIADEPTTALDVTIQAQILDLIRGLVRETGVGVLLITHNMGVVSDITDRVAIMRLGKVVEIGKTKEVLNHPRQSYSRMLINSVPPSDRRIYRFPVPDADGVIPVLNGRRERCLPTSRVLLKVRDLSVIYRSGAGLFSRGRTSEALSDVSFDLLQGRSLGLVGESGSGKSTCARAIVGLAPISRGRVSYMHRPISDMSEQQRRILRSDIQMIFQNPFSSLNPRMRVLDIIAEPIHLYKLASNKRDVADRVRELLKSVRLTPDVMARFPHQFSGGQRQRIAIARALASDPKILICDEPTSALDVSVQAQVLNLIKDLQEERGLTLLFISHDLPVVRQICDDVLVLKGGRVVEYRPTEELFEAPQAEFSKELLIRMPRFKGPIVAGHRQ